jgi:hypothetical protein
LFIEMLENLKIDSESLFPDASNDTIFSSLGLF